MKKKIFLMYLLSTLLPCLWLVSCTDDKNTDIVLTNPNSFLLQYKVLGGEEITRATPASDEECLLTHIYTLYFNSNRYVGYTRTALSSTSNTGAIEVALPDDLDINAAYTLVFLANLDYWANLEGASDTSAWLTSALNNLSLSSAKNKLTALADEASGIKDNKFALLMSSGDISKAANAKIVNIELTRAVARIDVKNTATSVFEMESAMLWNARTTAYAMTGDRTTASTTDNYIKYTDEVEADNNIITGELYVLPNYVSVPTTLDKVTTCLIVKGKYRGGNSSYYRVNVVSDGSSQNLLRNTVYTININKVTANGHDTPEEAYNNSYGAMSYTLTDSWYNDYSVNYTYDKDGNGLGISQSEILFSGACTQDLYIQVYTVLSSYSPLDVNQWTVGGLSDNINFTVERDGTYIKLSSLNENTTPFDRQATFTISWGDISIPVSIIQLAAGKVELVPSSLYFSNTAATLSPQDICLNLHGDYTDAVITYSSSSFTYFEIASHPTLNNVPEKGLFYYRVKAQTLSGTGTREGTLWFQIVKDNQILYATANVYQGPRTIAVNIWEKDETGTNHVVRGDIATYLNGIPGNTNNADFHLHFGAISSDSYQYRLTIKSVYDGWKIIVPETNVASKLKIRREGGTESIVNGHIEPSKDDIVITVDAANDIDITTDWRGSFYIEYDSGSRITFTVHQRGGLGTSFHRHNISTNYLYVYYYDTFKMDGRFWTDRNLGATTTGFYGVSSNSDYYQIPIIPTALGISLTRAEVNTSCPKGFRLPTIKSDGSGELDWLYSRMKWRGLSIGDIDPDDPPYIYVHYVPYTDDFGLKYFCLSFNNSSSTGSDSYWAQDKGHLYFSSTRGTRGISKEDPESSTKYFARCVLDE